MRDQRIDAVLMGGDGLCSSEFPRLADGALDGKMYCPQGGRPLEALPEGKSFAGRFKAKFGVGVDAKAPSFYAATMMIGDAIVAANSISPDAIDRVLHQNTFTTMFGPVKFDARGEWVGAPMTVYSATHGAITPLNVK
jgi:branched-chain amino acid transport system substrate-binding protein